uniref:Uncharacterized protein n=1 Tax=Musa acuminata subsp. malaccensis TaxID=214687 RepID=A0A804IB72_MUSAM
MPDTGHICKTVKRRG